jgi:hypothetical protein
MLIFEDALRIGRNRIVHRNGPFRARGRNPFEWSSQNVNLCFTSLESQHFAPILGPLRRAEEQARVMLQITRNPKAARRAHGWNHLRKIVTMCGCACALVAISGCNANIALIPSPPVPASTVSPIAGSPIQHIVVIMQENRSFDNLFNGFPGADTAQSGMNGGQSIALTPISLGDSRDLDHSHLRWVQDWDNGKMDGFAQSGMSPATLPYSYVPEKRRGRVLDAGQAIRDRRPHVPVEHGPSFVAHQYMIAGQSANVAENPTGSVWGCDASPDTTAAVLGADGDETAGVFPCFDYLTIADLLDEKGVTWRYYAPSSADSFFILSAYQAIRHIRLRPGLARQRDLAAEPRAHRHCKTASWRR